MPQSVIIVDPKRELLGKQELSSYILSPADKEAASIKIEQVRHMQAWLDKASFNDGPRFCIIEQAETLTTPAQQALLKTLEEPDSLTTILLLTTRPASLLPTIRSRCAQISKTQLSQQQQVDWPLDVSTNLKAETDDSWTQFIQQTTMQRAAYLSKITKRTQLKMLIESWLDQLQTSNPQSVRHAQALHRADQQLQDGHNPRLVSLQLQANLSLE